MSSIRSSAMFMCIMMTLSPLQGLGAKSDIVPHTDAKNPSPKPYSECDEPSDEFFYLVQQWPPGYCTAEHCSQEAPEKFTIHGLWPNYCQSHHGHEWPQYCTREEFDLEGLSDLLPRMEENWISLSSSGDSIFWQHEWDKHGTCTVSYSQFHVSSQHEFFKTALDLSASTQLQNVLANSSIMPGGKYSVDDIQQAFTDGLGGEAYLHCQKDNILVEVYVCYNQEVELVSCSHGGTCRQNEPVKFLAATATKSSNDPEDLGTSDD